MRASTLAGAVIVVVAGLVLGAIAERERVTRAVEAPRIAVTATPAATASTPRTTTVLLVQAVATSNVYARPDRGAEVVAVLPGGQRAAVTGRSQNAEWLWVATPPTSALQGWTPVAALNLDALTVAGLPVVTPSAAATPAVVTVSNAALPDSALAEAFVLANGQLEVRIRNLGTGTLADAMLTLSVTQADGRVIGVFRIGPATLAPGSMARVTPPLAITEPGTYRLELSAGEDVPDAQPSNNMLEVTLTPSRVP